jgi:lysophospholipase L1-like esterase
MFRDMKYVNLARLLAACVIPAQLACSQSASEMVTPAISVVGVSTNTGLEMTHRDRRPVVARPNASIVPRLTQSYMRAHSNYVEIARKGDIDVLFLGDSITDWWRNAGRGVGTNGAVTMGGKAVFEKYFGSWKVANFGIAGDSTQGVLWRLRNGEGDGFKPKAVMLMIGTNNTGGHTAPEVAMGVANVVFELRQRFPDARILLLAIFPRSGPDSEVRAKIREINQMIAALHDGQHTFFMDIGPRFLNDDGTIPREVMHDGLHPTSKGYEIWAEAVRDTLAKMMR